MECGGKIGMMLESVIGVGIDGRVEVRIGLLAMGNVESIADSIRRSGVKLPQVLARISLGDLRLLREVRSLRHQYAQFSLHSAPRRAPVQSLQRDLLSVESL